MSRKPHGKFRKLHKGIKRWAKKEKRALEIEAIRQGWKYTLDGEIIASSHTNNRELDRGFLKDLRKAGIPQNVIISLSLLEPDYEAKNENNLNEDLQRAQAGELVFHYGRQCLVTSVRKLDGTIKCHHEEWGKLYLLRCMNGELKCDDCDGAGDIEGEACIECNGNSTTSECPACFGVGEWQEYKKVGLKPLDEEKTYSISMNLNSTVFSENRTWWNIDAT